MRATKSDRLGSIQGCRCWAAVARPRPCLPLQLTSTQVVPSHVCVGVVCLVWSGPVLPNHRRPSARRPSIFRPFCISFGLARAGRQRGAPVTSTPSGPSGLSGPSSVRLVCETWDRRVARFGRPPSSVSVYHLSAQKSEPPSRTSPC